MDAESLTAELVRFHTESPAGDERACACYLRDYIADLHLDGFRCDLHEFAAKRANLIVRIGPENAPGLMFAGHTDTVLAGNLGDWVSDPFEPLVKEGRMFGRGTADMKAGLAALASSLDILRGKKLRRSVLFVATAGEENGCQGIKALIRDGKLSNGEALYGIVAEPTSLKAVRKHKGVTRFRVAFKGIAAHASTPLLGVNAIEGASRFMSKLSQYKESLESDADPEQGATTLPVTFFMGGVQGRYNVIPESCELFINCRRIPRHTADFINQGLNSIVAQMEADEPGLRGDVKIDFNNDALDLPATNSLVRMAEDITNERSISVPYATEAPYYRGLGTETIVLGPGSINQAHVTNEFVAVDEIRRAEAMYRLMIQKICL